MSALIKKVPMVCPACAVYQMHPVGRMQARCSGCGFTIGGGMLKTFVEILALPEALGTHACEECEHPQMVLLPGGVFHCPACRSEVVLSERDEALS